MACGLVGTLATMVAIIGTDGASTWATVAVGQAVGAFGGIAVLFGWGLAGPADIALSAPGLRPERAARSLLPRACIFVVAAPLVAVAAELVSPAGSDRGTAALAASATLGLGLGFTWYYIGDQNPVRLLVRDAVPRLLVVLVGVGVYLLGAGIAVLLISLVVAELLCVLLAVQYLRAQGARFALRAPEIRHELHQKRAGVLALGVAGIYVQAPLALASAVGAPGLTAFAVADRLMKYGLRALAPVFQTVQGFVPSGEGAQGLARRVRYAERLGLGLGLGAGVVFLALAPIASDLLTDGRVQAGLDVVAPLAVAVSCIVGTAVIGQACLPALGELGAVARSTVAGAVVGVPLLVVLTDRIGVGGTAGAMAAAEAVVLVIQVVVVRRALGRMAAR